jgi:Domain of unknown function (DUF6471)
MASDRKFFEAEGKEYVLRLLKEQDLPYWRLNEMLREGGVVMADQSLRNKLGRGRYSFAFALQVLHAMGIRSIDIPQPPSITRRAKKA